jgi:hypothetical protein
VTHIRLTLNGDVLMDGDLGQWQRKPPTAIQHLLKPGGTKQPYLQAALSALVDASLRDVDTHIECTTMPTGWNVRVVENYRAAVMGR